MFGRRRPERVMIMCLSLSALLMLCCSHRPVPFNVVPNEDEVQVVGRILRYPDRDAFVPLEELEAMVPATTEQECQAVFDQARVILDGTDDPFIIASTLAELSTVTFEDDEQKQKLYPIVERCLAHPDRLIRWIGIRKAHGDLKDRDLARRALTEDCYSLLIRPDPVPWWDVPWEIEWSLRGFYRYDPAILLGGTRVYLIKLLGEYRIVRAIPVLSAIAEDSGEWHWEVRENARQALDILKGANKHGVLRKPSE